MAAGTTGSNDKPLAPAEGIDCWLEGLCSRGPSRDVMLNGSGKRLWLLIDLSQHGVRKRGGLRRVGRRFNHVVSHPEYLSIAQPMRVGSGPQETVRESEGSSSDGENGLRLHGSDVGLFSALQEAYICDAILLTFQTCMYDYTGFAISRTVLLQGKHPTVFLLFPHRAHKPSEHG
jgi:hypothetical protein